MPFKVNPLNFRRIPRCRLTNSPLAGLPIPPSRDGISPQSVYGWVVSPPRSKDTAPIQVVRPSVKTQAAVCIARGLPTLEMTATD